MALDKLKTGQQELVLADNNSVVTAREIKDAEVTSIRMKTVVSGPASRQSGPVPQAGYVATGGSVICADNIANVTVHGDIDLSVTRSWTRPHSGSADETPPSSQDPAVKKIRETKDKLIGCLRTELIFVLQYVHAGSIVTDREYQRLKAITPPETATIELIDLLMEKGQESCSRFLDVLNEPELLQTLPALRKLELGNN